MAFHELPLGEIAAERGRLAAAALADARLVAARRLLAGPAAGLEHDENTAAALLTERSPADPRYETLSYFEKHWALLVLQLVAGVLADLAPAVHDARSRGATVGEIAQALNVTENAVYKRYGDAVVRRPRRTKRG